MKKYFLTAAALLLFSPLTASATYVGKISMKVSGTTNTRFVDFNGSTGGIAYTEYYADYDAIRGTVTRDPAYSSITFDNTSEVFCVENAFMYTENRLPAYTDYALYTSEDLNEWIDGSAHVVTWIANWALSNLSEINKAAAQEAIWSVMIPGAMFKNGMSTLSQKLVNDARADMTNSYVNDWLLAVSPANGKLGTIENYQNFLVKASATPVPEPGTMLLFGTGLAGLAAVSRRRRS